MDELCISKRRNLWLWTAVSRYTGQVLAWLIGSREWHHLSHLWERIPKPWRKRPTVQDKAFDRELEKMQSELEKAQRQDAADTP